MFCKLSFTVPRFPSGDMGWSIKALVSLNSLCLLFFFYFREILWKVIKPELSKASHRIIFSRDFRYDNSLKIKLTLNWKLNPLKSITPNSTEQTCQTLLVCQMRFLAKWVTFEIRGHQNLSLVSIFHACGHWHPVLDAWFGSEGGAPAFKCFDFIPHTLSKMCILSSSTALDFILKSVVYPNVDPRWASQMLPNYK